VSNLFEGSKRRELGGRAVSRSHRSIKCASVLEDSTLLDDSKDSSEGRLLAIFIELSKAFDSIIWPWILSVLLHSLSCTRGTCYCSGGYVQFNYSDQTLRIKIGMNSRPKCPEKCITDFAGDIMLISDDVQNAQKHLDSGDIMVVDLAKDYDGGKLVILYGITSLNRSY
jgi:hypothetical protein